MSLDRRAMRAIVAITALMLAAGTALAADPSSSPLASPGASASAEASASGGAPTAATESPEASEVAESPEPSESPEASESPEPSEPAESPKAQAGTSAAPTAPSADQLARVVDRLKAAGITATTSELSALAAKVGLGGAIRALAFAHASGKTPDQIVAMFESGLGWGEIDHQLGLSIGPGIGWIMGNGGGNGHGRGNANGHANGPKP